MMRRLNGPAALCALLALASFVWVAIPTWLIQPFERQTAREVDWSYALKSRSTWVTAGLLAAGLVVVFLGRRRLRTWIGGPIAAVSILILGTLAWFARQNHFEWMFNPIAEVRFAKAADADWVADQDYVLGVAIKGVARAYPVLALAYHHVVNDVVADEPIVATY